MFNRTRLGLTAWYAGILLVIIVIMAAVTYGFLARALKNEVDDSLRTSAVNIAAQLNPDSLSLSQSPALPAAGDGHEEHEDGHEEVRFFSSDTGNTFFLILSPEGQTLVDPLNVQPLGLPDVGAAAAATQRGEYWSTVNSGHGDYRIYSLPVQDEGRALAVVQVGRSLSEHEQQLNSLLLVLVITGGGGLALAAAGGLFVAGRTLRPIRDAFQRQRAFVADASHELRTPLTLVRGNAEIMQMSPTTRLSGEDKESLQSIVQQTEQMERLVADLATLALMEESQTPLARQPVDVSAMVERVSREGQVLARGRPVEIQTDSGPGLSVLGDAARLHQLLLVLVDNAVRYTPDGGRITIAAHRRDGRLQVGVSDTGRGITPEHLPHIFERFYRADESRSRSEGGTGLGLAIAKAIADAHGGTLRAESEAGRGTTFVLELKAE